MKLLKLSLMLTLYWFAASQAALAQDASNETHVVRADSGSCEVNSAHLDYLAQDFRSSGGRIFVIARLGDGESSRALNRSRLEYARFYLVLNRELNADRVVFAEGERVKGEGRLELYLGSKLYLVSLAKRNKMVCFFCCDDRPEERRQGKRSGVRKSLNSSPPNNGMHPTANSAAFIRKT